MTKIESSSEIEIRLARVMHRVSTRRARAEAVEGRGLSVTRNTRASGVCAARQHF